MFCISLPAIGNTKSKYSFASLFKPANALIYNDQDALNGTFLTAKAEVEDQRQSLHLKPSTAYPASAENATQKCVLDTIFIFSYGMNMQLRSTSQNNEICFKPKIVKTYSF